VLRLVRRDRFHMSHDIVHEQLTVDGRVERLAGELEHHTDPDLHRYLAKMLRYADLGARALHERGVRFHLSRLVVNPPATFVKRYVLKAGFRDGVEGLLLALLSAVHVLVKYARLWEIEHRADAAAVGSDERHERIPS
jgi:hypothetical protein